MEVLGKECNSLSFFSKTNIPEKIDGFDDLHFLFWSSPLNRGIVRMDLDEAAYVYKLVRSFKNPYCVEIGRFKGGSTFLIASAMQNGKLLSLDLHVKMMLKEKGRNLDEDLKKALKKVGLENKVDIIIADSFSYDNKRLEIDFLFIDGDHTYEGVKKDYQHWIEPVKEKGHILIHDAVKARQHTTFHEGVFKLSEELRYDNRVEKIAEIGSIIHYLKK